MEKKKEKFVIAYKNVPARVPFWQTLTIYLLYLHFPATTPLRIVTWTILGIFVIFMWVGAFMSFVTECQIDIFEPESKDDIRKHS